MFNDHEWKSSEDYNHYKKMVDVSRVFKFVVEFDEVCGQIIGRNPLPPIGEVFAKMRREESHRHVMLGKTAASANGPVEGSTLVIPEAQVSLRIPKTSMEEIKTTCTMTIMANHAILGKIATNCMVDHLIVRETDLVNKALLQQMKSNLLLQ